MDTSGGSPLPTGEGTGVTIVILTYLGMTPYFFCRYSSYILGLIPFSSRAFRNQTFILYEGSVVLGIISVVLHSTGGFFMKIGKHWSHFLLHFCHMHVNIIELGINAELIVRTVISQGGRFTVIIVDSVQFFHDADSGFSQ